MMTMKWDKFFAPTMEKFALLSIIFVLFVPFIEYDNGIRCIKAPCPSSDTGSVITYLIISPSKYIYSISAVNLVVGLVAAYLVSCAAIHYFWRKK